MNAMILIPMPFVLVSRSLTPMTFGRGLDRRGAEAGAPERKNRLPAARDPQKDPGVKP